jgi:hypothetical protein
MPTRFRLRRLSSHAGETATVCGTVTGVHYAASSKGMPTFINFDKPYPNQDFTVMIWDDLGRDGVAEDVVLELVQDALKKAAKAKSASS